MLLTSSEREVPLQVLGNESEQVTSKLKTNKKDVLSLHP